MRNEMAYFRGTIWSMTLSVRSLILRQVSRSALACLSLVGLALPVGCYTPGGDFRGEPEEMSAALSDLAKDLIRRAYSGLPEERIVDHHVHVVGTGAHFSEPWGAVESTGCYVNPDLFSFLNPFRRMRTAVFMDAIGVADPAHADEQYADRLLRLVRNIPHGKFQLLAFAPYRDAEGNVDWNKTQFHVPNQYVIRLVAELNHRLGQERFVAVGSVHPYGRAAVRKLLRLHRAGIRQIKWLPNAMNIDPSDPRCIPFYQEMARLGMALLCHTGDEATVAAPGGQHLGNPLRLETALRHGVTVVMLHCGRTGDGNDPAQPGGPERSNFDLFLDLMTLPAYAQYQGRLFGEISATTIPERSELIFRILENQALEGRLINGSDYPIPAFNLLRPTGSLLWPFRTLSHQNAISREEAVALDEIYAYNPLLFDFVVKRTLRHPATGGRLPDSVFLELPLP